MEKQSEPQKKFLYLFAMFWSLCAMAYILAVTFISIPPENVRFADTTLGFLLGTIVSQIISFFFGSSNSSQTKDQVISEIIRGK